MRLVAMRRLGAALLLGALAVTGAARADDGVGQIRLGEGDVAALAKAVDGPRRGAANRARDVYRHPLETLVFFGLRPSDTVVEISPGAGWYTEILAPYLRDRGHLYAARREIETPPPDGADMVLTFRNIHNWMEDGHLDSALRSFYAALKPGGVLGVEEHRAKPGTSLETMIATGYVTEDYVIEHARAAGFVLAGKSEINANPRDDTDHSNGVWSLPPTLRGGEQGKAAFLAIGESDRMTLRFVKPAAAQGAR